MPPVVAESASATSVLVIGSGFIGRTSAAALVAAGRSTTVLTRRPVAGPVGADSVVADLLDRAALRSLVRPGTAVVFAAGTSVPADDEADPLGSAQQLAPLVAVLDAVRRAPGASLLFVSSGGAVYGEPDALPIREDHPLRPRSAYGAAKAAAETYVSYFARRYGVAATSLRCGNAYGPGQAAGRGQGLIGEVLAAAAAGRTFEIWGDGSVRRDFVHIDDLAEVIVALCTRTDLPAAVNVGSGDATSVLEVIDLVTEVVGRRVQVTTVDRRPFDVHHVQLDIARLRGLIPFDPIPLRVGIRSTWQAMAAETVA